MSVHNNLILCRIDSRDCSVEQNCRMSPRASEMPRKNEMRTWQDLHARPVIAIMFAVVDIGSMGLDSFKGWKTASNLGLNTNH